MNKIAIIDLDSVLFSIMQGNKVLDDQGEPIKEDGKFVYTEKTELELIEASDFWMNKILTDSGAESYIAYIKGYKTTHKRKEVNSEYKSNRPKQSPKFWNFVKEYLILKWKAIPVHNIEVDDAVNITKRDIIDSFICAIDNDLLFLEGTHFNWRKNEWISTTVKQAEYKFWSDMIVGQSGDGLCGLARKGPKYVEKLFEEFFQIYITGLYSCVFQEYIKYYGEELGIEEFYKSYKCLKILDKFEGFEIPIPIEYKIEVKEEVKSKDEF